MRGLRISILLVCLGIGMEFGGGCGKFNSGSRAKVSGTVTWEGKPLEQGVILFVGPDATSGDRQVPATIVAGKYSLDTKAGPWIGMNRVEIRATPKASENATGANAPNGAGPADREAQRKQAEVATETAPEQQAATSETLVPTIPAKFNDQSTLNREIKPGDNSFDFTLAAE